MKNFQLLKIFGVENISCVEFLAVRLIGEIFLMEKISRTMVARIALVFVSACQYGLVHTIHHSCLLRGLPDCFRFLQLVINVLGVKLIVIPHPLFHSSFAHYHSNNAELVVEVDHLKKFIEELLTDIQK